MVLGKSTKYSMQVPLIKKGSRMYGLLLIGIRQLEIALKPAGKREIIMILGQLRLHYAVSSMTEEELTAWLDDYVKDLALYPKDILERTCIDYRRKGENRFFPKIGQLIEYMDGYWNARKYKLTRLQKLLEVSNRAKEEETQKNK